MDNAEFAAYQRAESLRAQARAKSAAKDPLKTGGGKGFEPSGTPTGAPAAPQNVDVSSGPTTATAMGGRQDTGAPVKSYGVGDDSESLDYMGHYAGDDVTAKGHNTGIKPLGAAKSTGIAKRGYRTIGGTAVHAANWGRGEAPTDLPPTRVERERIEKMQKDADRLAPMGPRRPFTGVPSGTADPQPRAISDVKLSLKHHKESIANDMKHAKEHMDSAKKHKAAMKQRGKQLSKKGR